MASSLPVKDLHEKLKNVETTDKWDILVSYSEKQLNQFLKKTWGTSDRFTNVHFERVEGSGKHAFTQLFDLKFHAPDLEFDTTGTDGGYACLTMPLSGKYRYSDDEPEEAVEIKEGQYNFKVRTRVAGMKGDGSDLKTGGSIINFNDEAESKYYITFHFDTHYSDWQLQVEGKVEDNKSEADALSDLASKVRDWFAAYDHVQWIDYSMAEVSNKRKSSTSDSDNLLTPSSFVFACQPGVLNVFIHSKGGTRGLGINPPNFGLQHEQHITPIPTEYHASIIISRQLFIETYLVENIKKLCPNLSEDNPVKIMNVKNGLKLELRYNEKKVIQCENFYGDMFSHIYKALEVNMEEHPLVLTIEDDSDDLVPKSWWNWEFSGHLIYTTHFSGGHNSFSHDNDSIVKATVDGRKTDFIQIKENAMNTTLGFGAHDQPTIKSDDTNARNLVHINLDTFDLHMPQLDFFRAQNIFAPGRQMVNAKKLMLPYDLVLVGDIEGTS